MVPEKADIYMTDEGRTWSMMAQTERGSKRLGVAIRASLRLRALEAVGMCAEARKAGLKVLGGPVIGAA